VVIGAAPVSSLPVGEQDAVKRFRAGVFGRAAATYDQVGEPLAALLGRHLVDIAGIGDGDGVLDVACGRGAVLIPAAETVGSGGRVIGIDLAAEMVELAADELRRRGLENAEARVADGERLDGFADGEFDCVACAFAIFFFPDPAGALAEFRRVLRPGGTVAISTWGKDDPRQGWYFALLKEFNVKVRMMTKPFDEAGQLAEALTTAGFETIKTESERHVVRIPDPETWWRWALSAGSRAHIEALDPLERERFKRIAFERLRESYENEPIEIAADVLFTVGHAPRA
jgi:ubiquinone/menaquinone biosynthesis C-methylase UbiE